MGGNNHHRYCVSQCSSTMLKARLPTQQELTDLYREVDNLRKDKKLKDDTIKFLQKEKEALMREVGNLKASFSACLVEPT